MTAALITALVLNAAWCVAPALLYALHRRAVDALRARARYDLEEARGEAAAALEDAERWRGYREGFAAQGSGQPEESRPYRPGTPARTGWVQGWDHGDCADRALDAEPDAERWRGYIEGRVAREAGQPRAACPHGWDTPLAEGWEDGWGHGEMVERGARRATAERERDEARMERDEAVAEADRLRSMHGEAVTRLLAAERERDEARGVAAGAERELGEIQPIATGAGAPFVPTIAGQVRALAHQLYRALAESRRLAEVNERAICDVGRERDEVRRERDIARSALAESRRLAGVALVEPLGDGYGDEPRHLRFRLLLLGETGVGEAGIVAVRLTPREVRGGIEAERRAAQREAEVAAEGCAEGAA